jgi:hypothetical protein
MPKAYQTLQKMTALFCYNALVARHDYEHCLSLVTVGRIATSKIA